MCIYATREGDYILFHHEGGVDVGDVDAKAQRLMVAVNDTLNEDQVKEHLLTHVADDKKEYGCICFHSHFDSLTSYARKCFCVGMVFFIIMLTV